MHKITTSLLFISVFLLITISGSFLTSFLTTTYGLPSISTSALLPLKRVDSPDLNRAHTHLTVFSSSGNVTEVPIGQFEECTVRGSYINKVDSILQNSTKLQTLGYSTSLVPVLIEHEAAISISAQIAEAGGTIVKTYHHLPLTAAKLPYEQIFHLARNPHITHIYLDQKLHACLDESVPIIKDPETWQQIETRYGYSINGSGIKIAILDTGIDASHPDLDDLDDDPSTDDPKIIGEADFTDEGFTGDGFGHGTHCASIAAGTGEASNYKYVGVAPGAFLLNGKVLDSEGNGYVSWAIEGIEWAVDQGADVISMSLGGSFPSNGSDPLSQAVDWAVSQGVVCVVAAGNDDGWRAMSFPAASRKAITVGASTKDDMVVWFSSKGPTIDGRLKPDVVAPGVDVIAARAHGTSLGTPINDYYTMASGTSMATPHVAGAVALILQAHPDWTPKKVKSALIATSENLEAHVWAQGQGRINVCEAIENTLFISPSTLNFGVLSSIDEVSKNFTIKNEGASTTVFLNGSVTQMEKTYPITITPFNFTLPENEAADVKVTVKTGELSSEGFYNGFISIFAGKTLKLNFILLIEVSTKDPCWVVDQTCTNEGYSMICYNGYLYVGNGSRVDMYDPVRFEIVSSISLPAPTRSFIVHGNYLYAGLIAQNPPLIAKINLGTFTLEGILELSGPEYSGDILSMAVTNNMLYASEFTYGVPYHIYEVNLTTFTQTRIIWLPHTLEQKDARALYAQGNYLYYASYVYETQKTTLTKIDLTTLERTTIDVTCVEWGWPATQLIAYDHWLLVFMGRQNFPVQIAKVDLNSFTVVKRVSLGALDKGCPAVTKSGDFVYCGVSDKIIKLDLNSLSKIAVLNLPVNPEMVEIGWADILSVASTGNFIFANNIERNLFKTVFTNITIDDITTTGDRVDVGSTQTVSFHMVWSHNGTAVKHGEIYVNQTRLVSDEDGWARLNVVSHEVTKKTWVVTGVNCSGVTTFEVSEGLSPPSIIWDRVQVTLMVSDDHIDVGFPMPWSFTATYAYDGSDATPWVTVNLNDTDTKTTVGKWAFQVLSILDSRYGLTAFSCNTIECIWDRVDITLTPNDERIDVGSTGSYSFTAIYEYDGLGATPYMSLTLNDTLTKNAIGKYGYTVSSISETQYGLTAFSSNSFYIIFDKVIFTLSVADNRISIGDSAHISVTAVYAYDNSPFQGSYSLNDTLIKTSVGKYGYRVSGMLDELYGLTVFESNEVWVIFDKVVVVESGVSNELAEVGETVTVWFKAVYAYDSTPFDSTQGILYVNGEPAEWSEAHKRWQHTYKEGGAAKITFTVTALYGKFHDPIAFEDHAGSQAVRWVYLEPLYKAPIVGNIIQQLDHLFPGYGSIALIGTAVAITVTVLTVARHLARRRTQQKARLKD